MKNEFMRVQETKGYLEEEKCHELWIRVEPTNHIEVIFRHMIFTSNKDLILILMTKQQEALDKVDEVILETKSHAMEACSERWKELLADLRSREPHSLFALNRALFRANICK